MVNYLLFLLQNISNIVAIFLVPKEMAAEFLSAYALSSAALSIFFTLLFASKKSKPYFRLLSVTIIFICFVGSFFVQTIDRVATFYVLNILLADYLISQMLAASRQKFFRILVFVSVVIFLAPVSFEMQLYSRAIFLLFISSCVLIRKSEGVLLNIRHGFAYLLMIYLSYSLVLYVITRLPMSDGAEVKNWYLATQISLVIMLKLIDFRSRSLASINPIVIQLSRVVPFLLISFQFYRYPNYYALGLALSGMVGLLVVEKYLIKS